MAFTNGNKPIVTNGLVYALDFGNPKSYVSGSSSAYNLAYSNITSSVITGSDLPIINGVAEFSGNSTIGLQQYVRSNSHFPGLFVDSGNATVMFVARSLSTSDLNAIISQWNSPTYGTATGILFRNNIVTYGGADRPSLSRGYNGNFNSLKHVTFRLSSGSLDCFINGIPVSASVYAAGGPTNNIDNKLTIAHQFISNVNQRLLSGSLGILQIYDRPLTSDEIWNNYQLTAPRYGIGPVENKPYNLDENAYLFLQSAGITDPIITGSIDTFVRGLKANNLWDKMIAIYPFVGTGSAGTNLTGSHKWNLKEPSLVTYPLSFTGSWNGSVSGSAPSGSNTNITVGGITPSQYYPFFNTQSAHISILSYDTPVSSSYLMGTGMTEDLAISTLAGDYGTPAAAYSVRKVRSLYTGSLMDVRRSYDDTTSSIGYNASGDLDTNVLLDWTVPGRSTLPGAYEGLAAAYSLRKVSSSYTGHAIRVRGDIENQFRDIGFDANGNLDTASLLYFTATGSNTLAGSYSGIAAAYSLRKVVPGYSGYAIEVRTGTVSQSIGFDSFGNLDTGSLLTFAGGSSAFIKTWYDQSGNNRHATQSVDAQQPRIVNNGLLVTQSGRPALDFNGSYDMVTTPFPLSSTDGLLLVSVDKPSVAIANKIYTYDTTAGQYWNTGGLLFSQQEFKVDGSSKINLSVSPETLDYKVRTYYATSTNAFMSINGRIAASSSYSSFSIPSPVNAFIGKASGGGAERYVGLLQELIFYSASQATNKNYIESNINAYYNVFTTSSTSTENAFVSTWYDQSGNNRHATQTATGSQPLIVLSGSLVTENGKPALSFDGVDDHIESPYFGGTINDQYFVTSTADTQFKFPRGSTGYGFVAQSGSTSTNLYTSYGTPTLYVNSISQSVSTRDEVYNALAGYKLSIHQNTDLSTGWDYLRFGTFISAGPLDYSGSLQEWLIYSSSVSASRPLIENNINNYYNIYTGSNHGFVARWYDQSGNNRHATQTATGSQPVIVLSSSVILDNNRPAVSFNGISHTISSSFGTDIAQPISVYSIYKPELTGSIHPIYDGVGVSNKRVLHYIQGSKYISFAGSTLISAQNTTLNKVLNTSIFNGASSFYNINSVLDSSGNPGPNPSNGLQIGAWYDRTYYFTGKIHELVMYPTNQSSNTPPIEYGINNYYNIYTQPTSSNWATSSFAIRVNSGSVSASLNNTLTSGISSTGPLGHITVSRTGSNSLTIAKNGVTSSYAIPASGALSTGIYLGAINNNSIALGNSPLNISFASVGTGLTNSELSTYYRLVDSFQINAQKQLPLLNLYGTASIAFSVRKLNSNYTGPAIDVQRSTDNAVQSIGFDSFGNLDTATLLSFVGSGFGYVNKWYDQSGNDNHLTYSGGTKHTIVENGILNTVNNKPSFNSTSGTYTFVTSSIYASASAASVFITLFPSGRNYLGHPLRSTLAGSTNHYTTFGTIQENIGRSTRTDIYTYPSAVAGISSGFFNSLYNIMADGTTSKYFVNGVQRHSNTYQPAYTASSYEHGQSYSGSIQEMISYNYNQTSNLPAIENNIRTYFNIY